MQQGPTQLTKLPFPDKSTHIHSHPKLPYLLRTSSIALQNYSITHRQVVREIILNQQPQQIGALHYVGKQLVYSSNNSLRIGEAKLQVHGEPIRHMQADETGLVLTAAQHKSDRTVKLTQVYEDKPSAVAGEFNFHYQPITGLYWHNSLAISADVGGEVCLWDVNKCQTLLHRQVHYQSVEHIGVYVDYTINNVYYTVSAGERRLIFSDLRTNKPIKIIANLHSDQIVGVGNTPSGKVYIAYRDIIDVVDIHSEYSMLGNYSPIVADRLTQMKWTAKSFSLNNIRQIGQVRVLGKYLIAGCDNGCIEVYDTDTMECMYGFGMVKYGPIRQLECNVAMGVLYALDGEGEVYMARFGDGKRGERVEASVE